jgi:hypothetical protein
MVQANAMDLTLFQFDYDLTFAALFLNADRTIYGRFSTRSSHDAENEITLDGFRKAMEAALELHSGYPLNESSLAGKQPKPTLTPAKTPEDFPSLRGKFKPELDYAGKVAQSCMHCHQIRDAERLVFRSVKQPLPDEAVFPYPLPDVIGMKLDPRERAKVLSVEKNSPAATAGVRAGDQILRLGGQPIISVADIQWVLHHTPNDATLEAELGRPDSARTVTIALPGRRRRTSDIAWRTSTWDLRRMGTGGLLLEDVSDADRRKAGLDSSDLALRVKHVGEYGEHAVAKRAGFRKGDIIVSFDGRAESMNESALLAHALQNKKPGDQIAVIVVREGERVELKLPMQ